MLSWREVLMRILALLEQEDVNWNKKSPIKVLKTALFDCAINKKLCSDDGGRGICPPFSSSPREIWQLKSPHPREFAIQGQKNANARRSARKGGRGGGWAQLELTDALWNTCIVPFAIAELVHKCLEAAPILKYQPLNSCTTLLNLWITKPFKCYALKHL